MIIGGNTLNKALEDNALFAHAFHHAPIGMALVDLNGKILMVNRALTCILGYSVEELISLTFHSITYPEDLQANLAYFEETVDEKRRNYKLEKRYLHKDGHIVWGLLTASSVCDKNGKPQYLISQLQDITEQKKAERELCNSEQSYRRLVEDSPDTVIVLQEGECTFINNSGVELLGYANKQAITGIDYRQFVHPSFHHIAKNRMKVVESGKAVELIEEKFVRADGQIVDVEVKSIPTFYRGKAAVHVIVRDIRERKKTEQFLIHSEKLNIAGQLAAGIAHEVRNPLTAIKGFFQLMKHGSDPKKPYFDVIFSEIERIESILNELLILAKPKEAKYEEKSLVEILKHVLTLIETQATMNGIEIETAFASSLPPVFCDESQLKQVFINFLKNAIEAMADGGKIFIQVRKINPGQILIRFVDQGEGIPEELLEKVGKPFVTTKENGTGLGLMICYRIIGHHNGDIHIESDKEGTTIEVTLPISGRIVNLDSARSPN